MKINRQSQSPLKSLTVKFDRKVQEKLSLQVLKNLQSQLSHLRHLLQHVTALKRFRNPFVFFVNLRYFISRQ